MSNKDKKATRAALRDFLIAIPASIEQGSRAMRWLVVMAAIALVGIAAAMVFLPHHPPAPPPGGNGDNPDATLYVRDLGRLPDGRHTFDLVYELVLSNQTDRPFTVASARDSLEIGTLAITGDVARLNGQQAFIGQIQPPPDHGILWMPVSKELGQDRNFTGLYMPGRRKVYIAHYRVNARPDQFAGIVIGYDFKEPPMNPKEAWIDGDPVHEDRHHEEVQLGAVLRTHCPLGVKIHNGETRSLCGS